MRSSRRAALGAVLLLALGAAPEAASQPASVPEAYKKYFVRFVDSRSITEKALNLIGLTGQDLGRSFALVAGVDSYPNLSGTDKTLNAARVDVESVVSYLRDVEFFDEIVVLRNEAVTDEALKYFFQAYFPDRLRSFPKSRFLFAYSGHGIQDGQRGYLLQAKATSFTDKANSINLEALNTIYRETTETAHQSLALINACYGGVFAQKAFGDGPKRLLPREPGAHAISAGAANELTWSMPNIAPGSLFFAKVFDGLAGSADSEPRQADGTRGDGVVTANELYNYVNQAVQLATDQKQHPVLGRLSKSGQNGEFFFLNRKRQVAAGTIAEWKLDGNPMGPGWELAASLPKVSHSFSIAGHSVSTSAAGTLNVDFTGSALVANVVLYGDLSDLQRQAGDIIRSQVNHHDDCDYILNVHTIELSPHSNSLRLFAAAQYEDWDCPVIDFGPLGKVKGGKHRLFQQDGDMTSILTPQTDGNLVWMDVQVTEMDANGPFGGILTADWFGPYVRDLILQSIPQVLQVGEIRDLLPPSLRSFPLRLNNLAFYDRGNGALGLRVNATVTVSQEYAETVWKQLKGL